MFDTISKGFRAARERLTGKGELTEDVIDAALKDVRVSLLEADVEFGVVKQFLKQVKEQALGVNVKLAAKKGDEVMRVRPEDHFIRICHDSLAELMGGESTGLEVAAKGTTGVMMVGLQGSGKTTTTGKLARKLQKSGKKVLLVAADVYRPAAVHQLQVLGQQLEIPVYARPEGNPVDICVEASQQAAAEGFDYVLYDTAGRLVVDEPLMQELEQIKSRVMPQNILLVIDSMIGQEAVTTAKAFNERLEVSGVVLTKLDGDARGGAALSIRAATGKPIKFLGMGETMDKLEDFRPDGLASRILGMGDIMGLIQDFQEVVDEETAVRDAEKMMGGQFTMDDFLNQIRTIQRMGSMRGLMEKLPLGAMFGGQIPQEVMDKAGDDNELKKVEAIIQSMTKKERSSPEIFIDNDAAATSNQSLPSWKRKRPAKDLGGMLDENTKFHTSRIARIAKGCGQEPEQVRELILRFLSMRNMMGMLGGLMGGGGGLMDKIPGMGKLGQLNAMRKMMSNPQAMEGLQSLMGGGGLPGMPPGGMPGMPGGFPGMPGMGGLGGRPNTPRPGFRSQATAKKKKKK